MEEPVFISVIICTYNRAQLLKRTLNSLINQTISYKKFEVIVIDDGSTDNTSDICNMMSKVLPNMRYVSVETNIGLGSARNLGIRSARGDYLLFVDDDCIANEDWAERLSSVFDREPIVAGSILSPTINYIKLCHNLAHFYLFMPGRKGDSREFIAGANMGMKRTVLEEINGFEEGRRTAEDMEFILRARQKGYRIYFASDAIVTHDPDRSSLSAIFKYSSEHASATILMRKQYRSLLRTPFVLRSPILILLTAPIIALRVTLGIYLGNLNIIKLFWTAPAVYGLKMAWCWGAARGLWKERQLGKKQ
jgi:glycosyltransferase involved in cell wall biosynthesis